jgi:hypothetical protein
VSYDSGPRLPAEVGSGAATCPTAPNLTSRLRWAPSRYPADRVPLYTSFKSRPVAERASACCHVPYGSGPHLSAEMGSGAAACPATPDLASRLGGLRRCHVSYGSRPRLPAEVGSGTATCPMALDLTSRLR